MAFNYSIDKKITDVLKLNKFTVSAEVVPPRNGQDQNKTLEQLKTLMTSNLSFLSVTKGAGGSLRGGSLPISQSIKDHFNKPCIAHFTCRDLLPQEIESQLIDHHYFGIRNILALRGDPPRGISNWAPRDGGYSYAYELIRQIQKLNEGEFLKRKGFDVESKDKTDFCIGAAVYPEHPSLEEMKAFTEIKFKEGAEYGITQMLFDPEAYSRCINLVSSEVSEKPILPGLRILKSKKQARIMLERFGCSVPDWYLNMLPDLYSAECDQQQILEPFYMLVEKLKSYGAPGIHIFVLSDTVLSTKAMTHFMKEGSA